MAPERRSRGVENACRHSNRNSPVQGRDAGRNREGPGDRPKTPTPDRRDPPATPSVALPVLSWAREVEEASLDGKRETACTGTRSCCSSRGSESGSDPILEIDLNETDRSLVEEDCAIRTSSPIPIPVSREFVKHITAVDQDDIQVTREVSPHMMYDREKIRANQPKRVKVRSRQPYLDEATARAVEEQRKEDAEQEVHRRANLKRSRPHGSATAFVPVVRIIPVGVQTVQSHPSTLTTERPQPSQYRQHAATQTVVEDFPERPPPEYSEAEYNMIEGTAESEAGSTLVDIIRSYNELARRASQEGLARKFWPLIDAFMNSRVAPRNSGEARLLGIWRQGEPLIGELHLTVQFPKDPFPGGNIFYKSVLPLAERLTAILERISEDDFSLQEFIYSLHCRRCNLSTQWCSYCVDQKIVLARESIFLNFQFYNHELKQISLQEARALPLTVELIPIPNNRYALRILAKINGLHRQVVSSRNPSAPTVSGQTNRIIQEVATWDSAVEDCEGAWLRILNSNRTTPVVDPSRGQPAVVPQMAARSRTRTTLVRPKYR